MKKILCLIIVMMSVTLFSFTAESAVNPDTQYNGHGYKIFNDGMTWQQAKTYCENLGGHLVTITSSQEQAVVVNLLRSKGNKNSYWLGGYYGNDRNWHWVTNEPFSYTNWGGGQPDYAFGRENCLMIYKSTANGWPLGDWNDLAENGRCDPDMINFFGVEHFGFICEWDSIPKTVTIPDGWYRIQPMHDLGRSADALGSQIKMGNNIYMWTNNSALQQKFYLQNRGDGYFSLQSAYGNKLYVTADGRDKGANLYTSPWMNNSAFQLFKLVDAGNNSYHIFAKVGDNLDFDCYGGYSSDGNNIQLWTSEDNPWHKWRFTKVILGNHPEGEVQVIESTSSNTLHVRGTAFDLDNPSGSTRLHVYVGGTPGSSVPQYEIRTDGNSRIFDDTREIDSNYSGRQNVHIYALNDYGEGDTVEIWNGFVDILSNDEFDWPVPGYYKINTKYTYSDGTPHWSRYKFNGKMCGIDISVPIGTWILAPQSGVVQSKEDLKNSSFGKYFEILHDDGTVTLYGHLSNYDMVWNGKRVNKGERIAQSGNSGRSTGPHLHFELSNHDTYQYYKNKGIIK